MSIILWLKRVFPAGLGCFPSLRGRVRDKKGTFASVADWQVLWEIIHSNKFCYFGNFFHKIDGALYFQAGGGLGGEWDVVSNDCWEKGVGGSCLTERLKRFWENGMLLFLCFWSHFSFWSCLYFKISHCGQTRQGIISHVPHKHWTTTLVLCAHRHTIFMDI